MAVQEKQPRPTQLAAHQTELQTLTIEGLIAGAIYTENELFSQNGEGQEVINPYLLQGISRSSHSDKARLVQSELRDIRAELGTNLYKTYDETDPAEKELITKRVGSIARRIAIIQLLDSESIATIQQAFNPYLVRQNKEVNQYLQRIQRAYHQDQESHDYDPPKKTYSQPISQEPIPDLEGRRKALKTVAGTIIGAGLITKFGPSGWRLAKSLLQSSAPSNSEPLQLAEVVKIAEQPNEPKSELQIAPQTEAIINENPIQTLSSDLRAQASKQIDIQISFAPQASEARAQLEQNPLQEVPNFDYAQAVDTLVQSIYNPTNFYEQDGQTLSPQLKDLTRQLATHPNEDIRKEAQDLSLWYIKQIQTVVTDSGDLGQALRMADLAAHLTPNLQKVIEAEVARAIDIHRTLSEQKNPQSSPENSFTQPKVGFRGKEDILVDQRIFEDPDPKTKGVPSSIAPFFFPSIGLSAKAFAAYLNSQFSIAEGIASPETRIQGWTATKVISLKEAFQKTDLFSKLPAKTQAQIANLPGIIVDHLSIITFDQENCSDATAPCQANALVFGNLIQVGQSFTITTLGEVIGIGEAIARPYQKTIKFFQK